MLPIIVKMLRVVSLQARYICGVSIILRTMVHNSAKLARQFAEEKRPCLLLFIVIHRYYSLRFVLNRRHLFWNKGSIIFAAQILFYVFVKNGTIGET